MCSSDLDDIIRVYPNVNGQGSAAVAAGRWTVKKICLTGSNKSTPSLSVYSGSLKVWSTSSWKTCAAP